MEWELDLAGGGKGTRQEAGHGIGHRVGYGYVDINQIANYFMSLPIIRLELSVCVISLKCEFESSKCNLELCFSAFIIRKLM